MPISASFLSVLLGCLVNLLTLKNVSLYSFNCNSHCACNATQLSMTCASLNLTSVPDNVSASIRFLNLSANSIQSIDDGDFSTLKELEYVDMNYNFLTNISLVAFDHNQKLRTLLLMHNFLASEAVLAAGRIPLKTLFLTGNRIRDLDRFFESYSLSFLDLSENGIRNVPEAFLKNLPNLEQLSLAQNQIETFALNATLKQSRLKHLNLSQNSLAHFYVSTLFVRLEVLDLSWNHISAIKPEWFTSFPNLTVFILTGNFIDSIPEFAFSRLPYLRAIEMNFLQNLTSISENVFYGLTFLEDLQLSGNSRLSVLDSYALNNLKQLKRLNLSNNNLSTFHLNLLNGLTRLEFVDFSGNPWLCDCFILNQFLALQNVLSETGCVLKLDPICGVLLNTVNHSALNISSEFDCRMPRILSTVNKAFHTVGSSALLNCVAVGHPMPQVIWITNRNITVKNRTIDQDWASAEGFFQQRSSMYFEGMEEENRMFVLPNGSLYIVYVTRKEAGVYKCLGINEFGNDTMLVDFELNYEVMSVVVIKSIILGFLTTAGFFLIAVIIGIARYLAFVCSKKERKKRKSIRKVLESIQDYKAAQFDRFSAYRTAKMDQLSAFKSAKIDQFSAFKHARVDKLRTYKQATVTSVLQYLERMREHYAIQTARIKDNCAQQMDRLRESYGVQRGKFKDYRSHQVERMRENYNAQVLKVREYGVQQMARLRDQYKSQQQNVLKLLELLDIGNCVTVIEAECMHTESVIFDASIAFDFEAHPIHVPRDTDSNLSDESHYLTASESGSNSNDNIPLSVFCTADVEPRVKLDSDGNRDSPGDRCFEGVNPGGTNAAESEQETSLST